ncbi:MAG TPA: hypothetical protein PKD02_10770, partial [Thermomonas sp.]|nr:hypothetical protein [Thermomonas sp.]
AGRAGGGATPRGAGRPPAPPNPPLPGEVANRGTSRLRQRVEPVLGAAMDLGAGAPRRPR